MLMPGEATKALEDCKEHETLLISNLPSDADEGTLKAFLIFKFKEKKTGMFIKSVKISGNFAQVRLKSKQGKVCTVYHKLTDLNSCTYARKLLTSPKASEVHKSSEAINCSSVQISRTVKFI